MSRFHAGKSGLHEEAHSARSTSFQANDLQKTTNTKLDTALVQQTAVNTKLDSLSGAINNNIGDATVKLQTYVYAHDVSNGLSRPLKCDSSGRLECSVDALEITAETINLSTDTLEAKTQAITDKLDTFAGAGNNNIGEGSAKLQTYLYARDVSAGNFKPLVCDSDAHLQIDCLSSALPTGAATAAHQATQNTHLSEIEGAVENVELTVGTNTATAPTRSLAIGGKYVDGTFRDIKVDSIGKVIVDSPSGSDLCTRLDAIQTAVQVIDNAISGNEMQVDVLTMPTVAVTLSGGATEAKQDVIETTLTAIETDAAALEVLQTSTNTKLDTLETTLTAIETDAAALEVLQTSTNTKLDTLETSNQLIQSTVSSRVGLVNTSVGSLTTANHTDLVALEASLTAMEGKQDTIITHLSEIEGAAETIETAYGLSKCNINISSDAVGLATQTTLAAAEVHLGNIDTGVDVLEACVGSNKVNVNIASNAVDFATQTTLAAAEAHLGNIDTATAAIATDQAAIEVLLTAANVEHAASRSKITDAEAHLGNIDTGVDVLEACVGSNKVNVNIASNAVDFATQTTLAAAEAHLGNIDTGVDVLEACVGSNKVNVNIASNAVDFATQTTLAAAEAHLGNIDTGVDVLEACVGSNKVNVNIASNAVDFATQTTAAAAEVHLGNIETKTTLATSAEIKELLSGATVNQATLSAELDTEHYDKIRFFGETAAAVGSDIKVFGSNTSGGTFYFLNNSDLQAQSLTVSGLGTVHYVGGQIDNAPRYIKIFNNSGSTNHTFTKLYMVGSGGRVAV